VVGARVCDAVPLPVDDVVAVAELDAPSDTLREGEEVELSVSRLEAVMLADRDPEGEAEPRKDLLVDAETVDVGECREEMVPEGECEMRPDELGVGSGEEVIDAEGEFASDVATRRELEADAAADTDGERDATAGLSVQLQPSCPTNGGQQPLKRVELTLNTGDCTIKSSLVWLHGVTGKMRNLRPYWKWKRLLAVERLLPVW